MNLTISSPHVYKWLVMASVGMGLLMSTLDISMVSLSFPILTEVFNAAPSTILWVSVGFLLISTGLALPLGTLGDVLGRRRVYTAGFLVFSLGLALVPFSQNVSQLIAFRILQGIGQGMLLANGNALVVGAFPENERGKALGVIGGLVAFGLAVGPVFAGAILEFLGWQALFWTRLPIGLVSIVIALLVLRPDDTGGSIKGFDYAGTITLFAGLSTLILLFNRLPLDGISSPLVLGLGLVTVVSLGLFFLAERRASVPVFDLSLFRNRLFATANASSLLNFVAQAALTFVLPFYLLQGIGMRPIEMGPLLLTLQIARLLVSPISGTLSDRFGTRSLCTAGLIILAIGYVLLIRLDADSSLLEIIFALVVEGTGSAIFQPPNNNAVIGSVSRDRLGMASAIIAVVRQVGFSIGIALLGTVYSVQLAVHEAALAAQGIEGVALGRGSVVGAYSDAYIVGLVFILIAIVTSALRGRDTVAAPRVVAQASRATQKA